MAIPDLDAMLAVLKAGQARADASRARTDAVLTSLGLLGKHPPSQPPPRPALMIPPTPDPLTSQLQQAFASWQRLPPQQREQEILAFLKNTEEGGANLQPHTDGVLVLPATATSVPPDSTPHVPRVGGGIHCISRLGECITAPCN